MICSNHNDRCPSFYVTATCLLLRGRDCAEGAGEDHLVAWRRGPLCWCLGVSSMNGRLCSSSSESVRGMESDSVFHNLLVCVELLPIPQIVPTTFNMNAFPVHCANQVSKQFIFLWKFSSVLLRRFRGSCECFWTFFRLFWGPLWVSFCSLLGGQGHLWKCTFTVVKPCFLVFWRVSNPDYFVTCFVHSSWR